MIDQRSVSPTLRPRRLRTTPAMRALTTEHRLHPAQLIQPLFIAEELDSAGPISSMPGMLRLTLENATRETRALYAVGIRGVLLFGIPAQKDAQATSNYRLDGIVQRTIGAIKAAVPEMLVIADLCNCEYTDHGHCGLLDARGEVDNDRTLEVLARVALTYARAGVDVIAPSDMMDGRVRAIRAALDVAGHPQVAIMSYAAKYASAFYGPFREAADCTPQFGDRRSYQMDPANAREALREVRLDVDEGADIIVIKPGLAYLDIVRRVREEITLPVAVYNVSGEYAMVKAAAGQGWIDESRTVEELLLCFRRAGADIIITYFAKQYAQQFAA
ncbi:MAG: porphobilinogen synthase [Candidatus Eremiobacteraeota bacterium]|nr:porphobilinogen synthase [Candidatus Eremiobacteraeota bacterium]